MGTAHARTAIRPGILPIIALGLALTACASGGGKSSAGSEAQRYLRLAQLQFEQGKTLKAIESARKAISVDGDMVEARNFLGLIYLRTSEYDKAVDELSAAVRIDPYYTDARNHLGVAYKEIGKYGRALDQFDAALRDKTYKTPEKIYLNIAHLHLEQGDVGKAIASFEQALAIEPDYLLGILGLGRAYQQSGRADLAEKAFRRVVSLAPDSPEASRARQLLGGKVKKEGS